MYIVYRYSRENATWNPREEGTPIAKQENECCILIGLSIEQQLESWLRRKLLIEA